MEANAAPWHCLSDYCCNIMLLVSLQHSAVLERALYQHFGHTSESRSGIAHTSDEVLLPRFAFSGLWGARGAEQEAAWLAEASCPLRGA